MAVDFSASTLSAQYRLLVLRFERIANRHPKPLEIVLISSGDNQ